jgi:nicotinamidase-related amidase
VSFYENLHLRKYTTKDGKHTNTNNNHALDHLRNEQVNAFSNDKDVIEDDSKGKQFKYKRFVPKANLFDTVLFEDGRVEQKLWPIHCIRNSWGAQFHPKLKLVPDSIRIQKGTLSHVDAYSAFWDNMRMNETGLRQELANKRVTDLFFCGLALDYCVAASALDAAKAGFITFVIDDACRGIDEQEIDQRKQQLRDHGAFIVDGSIALNYLKRTFTTQGDMDSNPDVELSKQYLSRSLIKTIIYRKASC